MRPIGGEVFFRMMRINFYCHLCYCRSFLIPSEWPWRWWPWTGYLSRQIAITSRVEKTSAQWDRPSSTRTHSVWYPSRHRRRIPSPNILGKKLYSDMMTSGWGLCEAKRFCPTITYLPHAWAWYCDNCCAQRGNSIKSSRIIETQLIYYILARSASW